MAGVDAVRYSLCRYPVDSPLTLDIAEITRQTSDNPVFYVQYAATRAASVLRHAAELGIAEPDPAQVDLSLLTHERETRLLLALAEFPQVVATAAELREPHRVARYLEEKVAKAAQGFWDDCNVLPKGDEEVSPLAAPRLLLWRATRTVLENGLGLLGRHRAGADVTGRRGARRPRPGHLARDRAARRRRAAARRGRRARPRPRARHPGVRPRRGRLPRPLPRLARGLRGRRRLLRRQGLPLHGGRPLGRRGGAVARRVHRRRARRRAARRLPRRAAAVPRQQQVGRRARARGRAPASGASSSTPRSRARPARAVAAARGRAPARLPAHHARRRGPHPRAHRHRPGGLEVRLLARRAAPPREAVRAVLAEPSLHLVGLHCHIGSHIFDDVGFALAAHRMVGLLAEVRDEHGARAARARPRRRAGHRVRRRRRPDAGRAARRGAARDRAARVRGRRAGRAAAGRRAGPRDRRPDHRHRVRGGHRQGAARPAHLGQRRRRHERQHPHRAVRRVLHGGARRAAARTRSRAR